MAKPTNGKLASESNDNGANSNNEDQKARMREALSPESIIRSQRYMVGEVSVDGVAESIVVGKPKEHVFFQSHPWPEYHTPLPFVVIDRGVSKDRYLIAEHLLDAIITAGIPIKYRTLHLLITLSGKLHFWDTAPLINPDETSRKRTDPATRSAHRIIEKAKTQWVRVQWDRTRGEFQAHTPQEPLDPPEWPDTSMVDLIIEAFEDHFIDSLEHPVVLALLRGEDLDG